MWIEGQRIFLTLDMSSSMVVTRREECSSRLFFRREFYKVERKKKTIQSPHEMYLKKTHESSLLGKNIGFDTSVSIFTKSEIFLFMISSSNFNTYLWFREYVQWQSSFILERDNSVRLQYVLSCVEEEDKFPSCDTQDWTIRSVWSLSKASVSLVVCKCSSSLSSSKRIFKNE